MDINSASSSLGVLSQLPTDNATSSGDINALRAKLQYLSKKLSELSKDASIDPKVKKQLVALYQMKIQALTNQIANLEKMAAQPKQSPGTAPKPDIRLNNPAPSNQQRTHKQNRIDEYV